MSTKMEKVRNEALSLSIGERASLAHDLILSLDDESDFELSPDMEREIQRRVRAVREGTAKGKPADQVLDELRSRISK